MVKRCSHAIKRPFRNTHIRRPKHIGSLWISLPPCQSDASQHLLPASVLTSFECVPALFLPEPPQWKKGVIFSKLQRKPPSIRESSLPSLPTLSIELQWEDEGGISLHFFAQWGGKKRIWSAVHLCCYPHRQCNGTANPRRGG